MDCKGGSHILIHTSIIYAYFDLYITCFCAGFNVHNILFIQRYFYSCCLIHFKIADKFILIRIVKISVQINGLFFTKSHIQIFQIFYFCNRTVFDIKCNITGFFSVIAEMSAFYDCFYFDHSGLIQDYFSGVTLIFFINCHIKGLC